MKKNVFELMRAFEKNEFESVKKWLRRRNGSDSSVYRLFLLMVPDCPIFPEPKSLKQEYFKKIYPKLKQYEDKKMRVLISKLNGELYHYFVDYRLRNDDYERDLVFMREMRRRHAVKVTESAASHVMKKLEANPDRGVKYQAVKLEVLEHLLPTYSRPKRIRQSLRRAQIALERLFRLKKIYYHRSELEVDMVAGIPCEPLSEEVLKFLYDADEDDIIVRFSLDLLKRRRDVLERSEIHNFINRLNGILPRLGNDEKYESLAILSNLLYFKAKRVGVEKYRSELFLVRKPLAVDQLWRTSGKYASVTFRQVFAVALEANENEWAEKFLKENRSFLSPTDISKTEFWCKTKLAIYYNDFESALSLISHYKINVEDGQNVTTRTLVNLVYFGLIVNGYNYTEDLEKNMNALEKFLWRNHTKDYAKLKRNTTGIKAGRQILSIVRNINYLGSKKEKIASIIRQNSPFPRDFEYIAVLNQSSLS